MKSVILSLDQGTTSSRAILFDHDGKIVSLSQHEFPQYFPKPGWVEHDPEEIWQTQILSAREAIAKEPVKVEAIGITNQRETTILWNKHTGKAVYPAIVWQCRRTADMIEELKKNNLDASIRRKTGLIVDPYFSASKIAWILKNVPGVREDAEKGNILFGTVDTYLLWRLTGGRVHVTDVTNASRTMLFNIHELKWDKDLLEWFDIPECILPRVASSSEIYGVTECDELPHGIPIAGMAGDQQSALFGQGCINEGDVKNTYGTGCFLLMNTGSSIIESYNDLLTTVAIGINGKVRYALEGSVFTAGAAVKWLRDEMKVIDSAHKTSDAAINAGSNLGAYLVPAFTGLGAPYWDPDARGLVVGITRGFGADHLVRVTLESIAYQTLDVLTAMEQDLGKKLTSLKVDGGASANDFLLQFQSDLLGAKVIRPECVETTAMGAAFLAGLACGFWKSMDELNNSQKPERVFEPSMDEAEKEKLIKGWHRAVKLSLGWEKSIDN